MPDVSIRLSRPGDEEDLKHIWKCAFGDEDEYINTFFDKLYVPGMAMVLEYDGIIVSAIYNIPMGGIVLPDGEKLSCAITYALGTPPQYRGRGYGIAVMKAGIEYSNNLGYVCNAQCPAGDSLFPYYNQRVGYLDCFYVREAEIEKSKLPPIKAEWTIAKAEPLEYNRLRNAHLKGSFYLEFDEKGISYQEALCNNAGGGLYRLELDGDLGLAGIEMLENGKVFIKELLLPEGRLMDGIALIASRYPADTYIARTPSGKGLILGGGVRRFAMIMPIEGREDISFGREAGAYFGFAYD